MNTNASQQPLCNIQLSYEKICEQNNLLNIEVMQLKGQISIMANNYCIMEASYNKLKSENRKLSIEIKEIKAKNDDLKKDISKKKVYFFKYIRQLQEINILKSQINDLKREEQEIKDKYIIDSNSSLKSEIWYDSTEYLLFHKNNIEMFNLFIGELIENSKVPIYGRRYSDFYKTICLAIFFSNTSTYKTLQKILPIPSITTLYYFSNKHLTEYKLSLQNLNKIDFIFDDFKKTYFENYPNIINCSLAIDQTIGIKNPMFCHNHRKNNYLCVYFLQPINNFYPSMPIYIEFNLNGRMNKKTIQNFKIICEKAKKTVF